MSKEQPETTLRPILKWSQVAHSSYPISPFIWQDEAVTRGGFIFGFRLNTCMSFFVFFVWLNHNWPNDPFETTKDL